MSNPVRSAIAATAVLAVAVVGYQLLPSNTGSVGGQPTATPPSTAAPSPTPVPRIRNGELAPGRYAFAQAPSGRLTFDVPAGWSGDMDGAMIVKHPDQPRELSLGVWTFDDFQVTQVYADACLPPDKLDPIGPGVEDLVTALSKQGSIDAVVSDIDVAGRPAKKIVLTEPEGLDRASCRHGADGPLQIWADSAVSNYFALAPGYVGVAYVAVGEERLVLFGAYEQAAAPTGIAEIDGIVASMRLE